ncbi:unknown [Sinorhizobium phage PBC5]|nr:unknown [Sinorhizobium phage PBC5]
MVAGEGDTCLQNFRIDAAVERATGQLATQQGAGLFCSIFREHGVCRDRELRLGRRGRALGWLWRRSAECLVDRRHALFRLKGDAGLHVAMEEGFDLRPFLFGERLQPFSQFKLTLDEGVAAGLCPRLESLAQANDGGGVIATRRYRCGRCGSLHLAQHTSAVALALEPVGDVGRPLPFHRVAIGNAGKRLLCLNFPRSRRVDTFKQIAAEHGFRVGGADFPPLAFACGDITHQVIVDRVVAVAAVLRAVYRPALRFKPGLCVTPSLGHLIGNGAIGMRRCELLRRSAVPCCLPFLGAEQSARTCFGLGCRLTHIFAHNLRGFLLRVRLYRLCFLADLEPLAVRDHLMRGAELLLGDVRLGLIAGTEPLRREGLCRLARTQPHFELAQRRRTDGAEPLPAAGVVVEVGGARFVLAGVAGHYLVLVEAATCGVTLIDDKDRGGIVEHLGTGLHEDVDMVLVATDRASNVAIMALHLDGPRLAGWARAFALGASRVLDRDIQPAKADAADLVVAGFLLCLSGLGQGVRRRSRGFVSRVIDCCDWCRIGGSYIACAFGAGHLRNRIASMHAGVGLVARNIVGLVPKLQRIPPNSGLGMDGDVSAVVCRSPAVAGLVPRHERGLTILDGNAGALRTETTEACRAQHGGVSIDIDRFGGSRLPPAVALVARIVAGRLVARRGAIGMHLVDAALRGFKGLGRRRNLLCSSRAALRISDRDQLLLDVGRETAPHHALIALDASLFEHALASRSSELNVPPLAGLVLRCDRFRLLL